MQNFHKIINMLRKKAKEFGIGRIFINYFYNLNLSNIANKFSLINFIGICQDNPLNNENIDKKSNYKKSDLNNFQIRLGTCNFYETLKINNSYNFDYYFSPDKLFMIIKIIIAHNIKLHKIKKTFILINMFNEFYNPTLFGHSKKYGFGYLNSLSKALFNLSYSYNYNLSNLEKSTKIAIQAHVYYEMLICDIIQKTNNIPVNFDLFITTDSEIKKEYIYNYVLNHSKADKYEIKIMNNKGRDVLPLLIQLKRKIKNYKYFCHLHTKKSKHINFGDEWRNYLYNNLLGSKEIISEILTEFEDKMNLGIIFPEIYYKVFETFGKNILGANFEYMESIMKQFAPYLRISIKNLDFPMGNMFWAKVKSVYQIFNIKLYRQIPEENEQLDGTLMHGIERIWIYLVKYNGYYYKKILKYL